MRTKKAFTLIEVLISIVLLGIIFTYLYGTINSLKQQNNPYLEKSDLIKEEQKIFKLINLDFIHLIGKVTISHKQNYDIVHFKTKNSIYQIIEPNVSYFVSKKDNSLIRIETLEPFDFSSKSEVSEIFLYADIISEDCISFKVTTKNNFVNVLFRTKKLKPMVLKIPTISKG
ncbi:MAG: prepilin-type N-terminal cleavage/methylation domain-containing protein [Campylobacterota bacterium]|nr:prepilin-type N-terminal cleavage/methylation domain-containing protein [Campylobacterota bacterium]